MTKAIALARFHTSGTPVLEAARIAMVATCALALLLAGPAFPV